MHRWIKISTFHCEKFGNPSLDATPSGLSVPHLHHPPFLRQMPFLPQPSQIILAWDRHRIMLPCIPGGKQPRKYNRNLHISHCRPSDLCTLLICTSGVFPTWCNILGRIFSFVVSLKHTENSVNPYKDNKLCSQFTKCCIKAKILIKK